MDGIRSDIKYNIMTLMLTHIIRNECMGQNKSLLVQNYHHQTTGSIKLLDVDQNEIDIINTVEKRFLRDDSQNPRGYQLYKGGPQKRILLAEV